MSYMQQLDAAGDALADAIDHLVEVALSSRDVLVIMDDRIYPFPSMVLAQRFFTTFTQLKPQQVGQWITAKVYAIDHDDDTYQLAGTWQSVVMEVA